MKQHYIIPIFVPHEGCPHDCVFCNQEEITGVKDKMTPKKAERIIEEYLSTMNPAKSKIEIAFYGGSFTGLNIEKQNKLLKVAHKYYKQGLVDNLRLSTRPDYIDEATLNNLAKYDVKVIELGVQSLVEEVLNVTRRGHTVQDVIEASKLIKKFNFKLGIQLMPGLPGADTESMFYSAKKTVELSPDLVRIYPTLVIRGTYLAELYSQAKFAPLSLEEAVDICKEELKLFRENNIVVVRIGLQPSAGINKDAVIAGPFHPAFRQLVESKLVLDQIKDYLGENIESEKLILKVNPRFASIIRGQRNKNVKELQRKYGKKVRIEVDEDLDLKEIIIQNNEIDLSYE